MNKLKENKAITLIALIITIIVLLILAGVVISMTVGNDGIITKAQGAVDAYKNAQEQEEAVLNQALGYMNGGYTVGTGTSSGGSSSESVPQTNSDASGNQSEEINTIQQTYERNALEVLKHFDGASSEGIDSSLINTSNKKFGTGSLSLNQTNLLISDKNVQLSGDFTIDFWLYLANENLSRNTAPILTVPVTGGIWIGYQSNKFGMSGYNSPGNILHVSAPSTDEWVHVAICRKDNLLAIYYNGILQGAIQNSVNYANGNINLGTDGGYNYTTNSYIDELRILNGYCAWTPSINIPTENYSY